MWEWFSKLTSNYFAIGRIMPLWRIKGECRASFAYAIANEWCATMLAKGINASAN